MIKILLRDVLANMDSGARPQGGAQVSGVPSLGAEHLDGHGGFNLGKIKYIPEEFYGGLRGGKISRNDILIVKDGATTGKTSFVTHDFPFKSAAINEHVFRLTPDVTKVNASYLFRFLSSPYGNRQVMMDFHGATVGGISRRIIDKVKVPVPPLPEQKRIAAILDKADVLRQKRKQSLKLLDEFIRAVFLDMFGDPMLNRKEWPVYTVGQFLDQKILLIHKDGNFGSQYPRAHEFGESGVPFLTAKAVSDAGSIVASEVSFLDEDKANTLPFGWIEDGDVLLAHNATVGRVGLYRGQFRRALIGTSLTCYRPNPNAINSAFLFALLRSHLFQSQLATSMGQTTRNQVPITAQRQMKLVLPPLEKQIQFDGVMKNVDKIREHNELAIESQEELFNSLVQRAFRGEL